MDQSTNKSPSQIGAQAELAVASALNNAGLLVLLPFFKAHSRVDLVYENSAGVLRRVQCKSAHQLNDNIAFYACSHTGGVERGYIGEVDEFGVYSPATGLVYMVPVEDVPGRFATLRLTPTRNNQSRRVRWAETYVLGPPW